MARINKTLKSGYFELDGGLDRYHDTIELANNKLQSGKNFHIDGGKLRKRPGRRKFSTAYASGINGMHNYIDKNGVERLLVASDGKVIEDTGSVKTNRDTGLTDEKLHFHTLRGIAYYNGANTQRKIINTTSGPVGLASPASACTAATGGAGSLTGDYAFVVTFVIKASGVVQYESNPSAASNSVSPSSEEVDLSSVPVSSDARVTHRRIYRTVDGGSNYYYDGEIADNTTTTYTSTIADAALGDKVEQNHGVPVSAEISTGCNERQFWLEDNKLYYSEIGLTDAYLEYQKTTNYKTLPNNGKGSGIKAVYDARIGRENLYVFMEDSVCILPDGDPNNLIYTIAGHIGCASHDSIAEYNGNLIFLSNLGSIAFISGSDNRVIDLS